MARHDATETIVGASQTSTVVHDQHIASGEGHLAADLGLSSWLGVGLLVPMRFYKTSIRYLDPSGQPVAIENPSLHHRDETLTGIGDPWIYGRVGRHLGGFAVGARAGITIPLGRTVPDPFVLGDAGLPHEHSQFGTGTIGAIAGIDASRFVRGVHLEASALTIQTTYANHHGYQAGDRYAASLGAATSFGTKRFRFRATLDAGWETAERWGGTIHTDDGNVGRVDVLAGGEVTWLATDDWHIGLAVKAPVYTHIKGGQLDALGFAGITVGTHFHLFEEHAAPTSWTGLDKQDASTDGRVVPLLTVRGKITVYDLWAPWCKPCGVLDRELAAIAQRHPNDLAVRKIDIVDVDSPAAQHYLGDATIPHVKVFGRDGELRWERSASPLALAAAVEAEIVGPRPKPAIPATATRFSIDVAEAGFVPAQLEVPHGPTVVLVFTRRTDKTCATDVHLTLLDGTTVDAQLPLNTPVEIAIPVDRPGRIEYVCGMHMNHGAIVVR